MAGHSTREAHAGTFTFVFVDLADSTSLLNRLAEAYDRVLERYHGIVRAAVTHQGGEVESTEGDGLFCVFPTPLQAAAAAHEIHSEMASQSWPNSVAPQCRIGIHTGTARRTGEGLVGLDVHRAARIGAAAQAGQVLLSVSTKDLMTDHINDRGWRLVDLGPFVLRGLDRSERLARLDFPDSPVVLLPPRARPYVPSTVPAAQPIIGRAADIRGASELLMRDSVRLVTITGPGGTGKTRLAIELANTLLAKFADGVVFVELAAVRDPQQFVVAVGRAMGIHESADRSIIKGLQSVVGASQLLLILDNMEQLASVADSVGQILSALPQAKILVTSRSPLRISWEHEYPLTPLSVPPPRAGGAEIRQSEAVSLLVERARSVRPGFELSERNEPAVAEITRQLDGLPLAIELAAARLRIFTPETLLARLNERLDLLDRGPADLPERHRTLRAAVQWSYDLLDDAEKSIFGRLGVFAGGWPLEGFLKVCVDEQTTERQSIDTLEDLVAKSLVVFAMTDDGQPRYRMLETLRDYSLEKLSESGEEATIRSRHLEWCFSLATRLDDVLSQPQFSEALEAIATERYNLREALAWVVKTGDGLEEALSICGLLTLYWDTRGYVTEGLSWASRLLALGDGTRPTPGRALALGAVGWLAMLAGDPERSEAAMSAGVEMWRRLQDRRGLAWSLAMHGMTTHNLHEYERSEAQFREASELARQEGSDWIVNGWCIYGLAHIALARNDLAQADRMLRDVLEYSRSRGLTWGVGHAQLSLGVLAFMMGDVGQAIERLTESLMVRQQLQDARGITDCLSIMALLASVQGDHGVAAVLLGAAAVRREATGHQAVPWMQPMLIEATSGAQRALGAQFEEGVAEGRSLTTEQAIAYAIERLRALSAANV